MYNIKLIKTLKELFPSAVFTETDTDLQIGSFKEWDSLGNFNLLLGVEEAFGVRFGVEEMTELKSLKAIEQALKNKNAIP